uniref:Serpin domain-containing protein n=1 Tax=Romanomermis culicivorax TaxID=13658 RepID=A0A915IIE0_ROMCU
MSEDTTSYMEFKPFIFALSILSMAIFGSTSEISFKNNAKFTAHFCELLKRQNDNENFVFSPISIEMLLATMWPGLGGNTSEQIKKHIFHCEDSDHNCIHGYVLSLRKS